MSIAELLGFDGREHTGSGSGSLAPEDADVVKRRILCDAIGRTADRTRYVSSVPVAVVAILAVADEVSTKNDAAPEFRMRRSNARVDDVNVDSGASRVVVVGSVEV